MAVTQFDSATYLRGLGWNGPGSSLNNSASGRAKPVTVAQKKTLSGVGRDRDTSFAWWDAVFTSVAQQVGGNKTEHHRTSTGILSHRPPPPEGNAYQPLTDQQKSGLNLDAMAAVKLELARRQLYSGFLRGTALSGSGNEEDETKAKTKGKGGKENAVGLISEGSVTAASKKRKREGAATATGGGEDRAARKAEKRRRKDEEKAAKRAAKAARKGKARAEDDGDSDSHASTAVDSSTTVTPALVESGDLASAASEALTREDRRVAEKAKKRLEADSARVLAASSSSTTPALSSAQVSTLNTPAPSDLTLDEEELAYIEAKAAAKRAEKEERRLARAAKKAAKAAWP